MSVCVREYVCVCVCVCACVRLTTVNRTAHQPSAHPLTCPERRAHEYTLHALASSPQARPHRAKRSCNTTLASTPCNLPNLHAHMPNTTQPPQQLRLLPSCNASEHHPREHHPSRNTITRTPPARGSAQPVKHPSNTRQRSQSSKAQLTPCVQADVRQSRPTHAVNPRRRVVAVPVVVPRAPSRRTPTTQAAKATISDFNHS